MRHNRRKKLQLSDEHAARLRLAAKKAGLDEASFMRNAILRGIEALEAGETAPAAQFDNAKNAGATVRKKLFLTPDENGLLKRESKAAGLLQQDYMRHAVRAALTQAPPPKRKASVTRNELAHEISMIAFQLKKAGTNLNQIAKQANTGLVPITRAEVIHFMNTHQRVLTLSVAALEKVLA
jgi:hypothetical protein